MPSRGKGRALRFPCECVSVVSEPYSDPWAEVTKRKLMPNGTKEEIINLVADEPKTLSQLAEALKLSAPSVHSHINDMLNSELLRESERPQKKHPTERYYEPNFPVFKSAECAEFKALCEEMAGEIVQVFEQNQAKIEKAFKKSGIPKQGWEVTDVTQCLYANTQRAARSKLEQRGLLKPREKKANGAKWVFWAEEP